MSFQFLSFESKGILTQVKNGKLWTKTKKKIRSGKEMEEAITVNKTSVFIPPRAQYYSPPINTNAYAPTNKNYKIAHMISFRDLPPKVPNINQEQMYLQSIEPGPQFVPCFPQNTECASNLTNEQILEHNENKDIIFPESDGDFTMFDGEEDDFIQYIF